MTSHWITLCSGRDHFISGIDACLPSNTLTVAEIAHSLAQINRFTGHALRPYSVAEHSLLVCDIVRGMGLGPHAQRAALLHDAHEAVTGDVASPIKLALGEAWHNFEAEHARALRRSLGLQTAFAAYGAAIKRADLLALATERLNLTRWRSGVNADWPVIDTHGMRHYSVAMNLNSPARAAQPWTHWRDAFAERHAELSAACVGQTVKPAEVAT